MTADLNENSSLRPQDAVSDRELKRDPTPDPAHPRHKVLRIVLWSLLLLVIVLVIVFLWHHHEEAKKAAAKARQGPPGITITDIRAVW